MVKSFEQVSIYSGSLVEPSEIPIQMLKSEIERLYTKK